MAMLLAQTSVKSRVIFMLFALLLLEFIGPVDGLVARPVEPNPNANPHPELDVANGLSNIGGVGGLIGTICAVCT
jgi:hypothetical protein